MQPPVSPDASTVLAGVPSSGVASRPEMVDAARKFMTTPKVPLPQLVKEME